MRQGGKYKFVWIALVAVVAAVLIMMVPKVRHDSLIPDVPKANEATNHAASVVTENKVQSATKRNDGKRVVRTMRFLELARQFVPEDQRAGIDKDIAKGVDALPDRFAKFTIQYMEFFGYLKNKGLIETYYDALKKEYLKNSNDINVLRFLAAIASIPSLNRRNEYEAWLGGLAKVDSHEDVLFPYAEMLLAKGDAKTAYQHILRTVVDYPSEASEILTNSLRIFTENKATEECGRIVEQLKKIADLDSFHANSCGDTLFKDEKLEDASYFYRKCSTGTDSTFFKELSDVKLCTIDVRQNKVSARTIARLNDLVENARTPAVRIEARKDLIALQMDIPGQSDNSNPKKEQQK